MTPALYLDQLTPDRQQPFRQLRQTVLDHLPPGFQECISYGMLGYVVPHSRYAAGYHCDPKMPLPFISLASQKSHIAFYHMGLYADPEMMKWIVAQWPLHSSRKPDMGKSCLRFKKPEDIPFELIGRLCGKMTPEQWIACYERQIKR